jgi:DNA-binding transcriptional regulator YiaG
MWSKGITMIEKKLETFIYTDLGFPIELINAPMRKILGEWILDINLNILKQEVLKMLIYKPTPLQADELRFIRKYFEMTTTAFGEVFGVSHPAVIKWEKGQLPTLPMDIYIRMYVMDRLKAKNADFGKLFHEVSMATLSEAKKTKRKGKPFALNVGHRRFKPHKVNSLKDKVRQFN